MIKETNPSPKTSLTDWVRIILFAHRAGYLYTDRSGSTFAIAYRIPEWKEEYAEVMPAQEGGKALYVSMAISRNNNKVTLLKMLKDYKKFNDVEEIVYHRRGSDSDLVRFNLRRKDVQTQST